MAEKVVLGLGNLLCEDDGLGICVLRLLESGAGSRFAVDFIDGGVLGMGLLPLVESCSHLLVLDAIDMKQRPGTVLEMARGDLQLYGGQNLSEHQVTFQEVLAVAALRQSIPSFLHIVGVQPASMAFRMGLTPNVREALPEVADRAIAVLKSWGLECEHAALAASTKGDPAKSSLVTKVTSY